MRVGFITQEADPNYWYIVAEELDVTQCTGGTGYGRITGQWKSAPIEVVTSDISPLRVYVPQDVLPNGVEGDFYIEFNMNDGSTIRWPEVGVVVVKVFRG